MVDRLSMRGVSGGSTLSRPHLLDITMFWSPRSGGVARYLRSKRDWLSAHSNWRHTILAPGPSTAETSQIAAVPLPWSGGYRFPLRRAALARSIVRQQPDLIEVGDPYRCAWSALDAGQQLGVPVAAFYHSNLEALAQRWMPRASHGVSSAIPTPSLSSFRRSLRAEPLGCRRVAQSRSRQRRTSIARRRLQPVPSAAHDPQWRAELGCTSSDIVLAVHRPLCP